MLLTSSPSVLLSLLPPSSLPPGVAQQCTPADDAILSLGALVVCAYGEWDTLLSRANDAVPARRLRLRTDTVGWTARKGRRTCTVPAAAHGHGRVDGPQPS
jgi:hypothetical protein